MRIVTLSTDSGTRDWFGGTMKGVIHGLAPHARPSWTSLTRFRLATSGAARSRWLPVVAFSPKARCISPWWTPAWVERVQPLQCRQPTTSPDEAVAVVGSCGLIEIAVNGGSAADKFGLKVGDRVELRH